MNVETKLTVMSNHTEELPVKLTDAEVRDRGIRLAQLQGDLATHSMVAQEKKAELKAREKEIEAKIAALAATVRSGRESREVWVDVCIDGNMAVEIRQDTGEAVRQRPLRDDERQARLFQPDEDGPQKPTDMPEEEPDDRPTAKN